MDRDHSGGGGEDGGENLRQHLRTHTSVTLCILRKLEGFSRYEAEKAFVSHVFFEGGRALLADKRWVAEIWNDRSGGLVTSDGRPRLQETNACCIGCVKPYRPINEEQYELNRLSGGVRAASDGIVHRQVDGPYRPINGERVIWSGGSGGLWFTSDRRPMLSVKRVSPTNRKTRGNVV
ncbi:hypothetical protein DPX16_1242 [Anabarilius grahami]|uniref:Uncharacterized protein n=1 Tax=Anabarilius grahami TaxID=495550 RepID=A0A3N0YUL3_ANAGA|nr:hypothetical protein DPX16_1242 [Anabarilius grahami]